MSWVFVVSPATLGTTVHINLRTVLAFALLMKRLLRLTISRATLAASKDIQRKQWISILEAFGVFEQCCKCGTPITRHANLFSIPGNLQENCAVLESLALEEPFQAGWKSCWLVVEWWILVVKNCKKALKSEGIHTSANPKTVPKHAESVDHVLATATTTQLQPLLGPSLWCSATHQLISVVLEPAACCVRIWRQVVQGCNVEVRCFSRTNAFRPLGHQTDQLHSFMIQRLELS